MRDLGTSIKTYTMDLNQAYNRLLFWVNKYQSAWFPPPELDDLTDFGQLTHYKKCFIKYGTGQRLDDALAPFKVKVPFVTDANGFLTVPDNYMDLIDIQPIVNGNPVTCPVINEDEITNRINSQVNPLSTSAPIAEIVQDWNYQLYPKVLQSGTLSYFMRPPKPFYSYTVVSGRVIVYSASASTQLLWGDDEVNPMLLTVLETMGINLSAADLVQWADGKQQQDMLSVMKQ